MTEFEIVETARLIRERDSWELYCKGCKWLGDAEYFIGDRKGKTYHCMHPDRQGGFNDPRPYGCQGYRFEKKED